jgi:hypothetical protein
LIENEFLKEKTLWPDFLTTAMVAKFRAGRLHVVLKKKVNRARCVGLGLVSTLLFQKK